MQILICPIHLIRAPHFYPNQALARREPSPTLQASVPVVRSCEQPARYYSEDRVPKFGDDQLQVLELSVAGSSRFVVGRGVETVARQRQAYSNQEEASPRKGFTKLKQA